LARAKVPRPAFDYIAGGADDEVSLRRNREAYGKWALRPRVLVDVSSCDTSATVLDQRVSMPILVAPTAFHRLVHPDGEIGTARGTAAAGTIMVVSAIATRTMEEIAAAIAAPRWFQLYVWKDREVTADLVKRAARAGYRAICLTVDTPLLGRREKDERNAFTLPPGIGIANVRPAGLDGIPDLEHGSAFAKYVKEMLDPAVTWRDLAWLRSWSRTTAAGSSIRRQRPWTSFLRSSMPFEAGRKSSWTAASGGERMSSRPSPSVPEPSSSGDPRSGASPSEGRMACTRSSNT
jgi:4-hydroxymandelate oxidase